MSRDLIRLSESDLRERLRARLLGRYGTSVVSGSAGPMEFPQTSALLLDYSGSMGERIGANLRAIDALRKVAEDFPGARKFVFANQCRELKSGEAIPEPEGGTALHRAFQHCKTVGLKHLVLVTDGEPNDETMALRESKGLKIDVFFCGPAARTEVPPGPVRQDRRAVREGLPSGTEGTLGWDPGAARLAGPRRTDSVMSRPSYKDLQAKTTFLEAELEKAGTELGKAQAQVRELQDSRAAQDTTKWVHGLKTSLQECTEELRKAYADLTRSREEASGAQRLVKILTQALEDAQALARIDLND